MGNGWTVSEYFSNGAKSEIRGLFSKSWEITEQNGCLVAQCYDTTHQRVAKVVFSPDGLHKDKKSPPGVKQEQIFCLQGDPSGDFSLSSRQRRTDPSMIGPISKELQCAILYGGGRLQTLKWSRSLRDTADVEMPLIYRGGKPILTQGNGTAEQIIDFGGDTSYTMIARDGSLFLKERIGRRDPTIFLMIADVPLKINNPAAIIRFLRAQIVSLGNGFLFDKT